MKKLHYSGEFRKCGAEAHPGFSTARKVGKDKYVIDFPIEDKRLLWSRKAQKMWAENKLRHLRSWGVAGTLVEHQ